MASTFLPFIKETSSEEALFKAILQRTKDSGPGVVANLFSIVIELGIKETRKRFDSYAKELTTSAKVQDLIANHPEMHMNKKDVEFWSYVMYMERTNSDKHPSFRDRELEIFFSVIASKKPESLKKEGFDVDVEKYVEYVDPSFNTNQYHFSNITLTEKSTNRVGFTCWEEFKAFMVYSEHKKIPIEVYPVFIDKEKPDKADYEYRQCESPYSWK